MSPVPVAEPSVSLTSTSQTPNQQLKNTFSTTASSTSSSSSSNNDANAKEHNNNSNNNKSRVSDSSSSSGSSRLELSNKATAATSAGTPQHQQHSHQPYSDKNNMKTINNPENSFECNKLQKESPSVCITEEDQIRQTKENKIANRKNSVVPQANSSSNNNNNDNCVQSKANDNVQIKKECDQSIIIKSENVAENVQPTLVSEEETQKTTMSMDNITGKKPRSILLSSVNPHIICNLCFGYLIDATTIVECLHSFCHSCLIKHLRTEQYCPRCEMMINTAKPNIKPDTTLQAIVYKLVPGLYERELIRKRAFYKDRPVDAAQATPEQRGDDTEHLIFSPSDYMSLSLEYADIDEHINTNADYSEILKPRYLQCPSMYTVAHLKKFVHGKFEIDNNRFNIDIMYKVKTIVLLDHYTLMDVAYIYTWKRDAPMRFYFRVKESLKPLVKIRKPALLPSKSAIVSQANEELKPPTNVMSTVHEPESPLPSSEVLPIIQLADIKVEDDTEAISSIPQQTSPVPKQFEIVPQAKLPANSSLKDDHSNTDKLKITLVSKTSKDKHINSEHKSSPQVKSSKDKKEVAASGSKDERKVENIKLKIDLSKQNSVTIINMSDPHRKEVTKSVKPEKEWKVKNKKDKDGSPKSSPNSERRRKTLSPLTVPPITIKAERISPLAKTSPSSQGCISPKQSLTKFSEEEKKSLFLKSFALAPIKDVKLELNDKMPLPALSSISTKPTPEVVFKTPANVVSKLTGLSKRKSKEPIKAITKKPKLSNVNDFKIKLPSIPNTTPIPFTPPTTVKTTTGDDKPLMPPPAPLSTMRPPMGLPKRLPKSQHKFAPPGSLTPHPMQPLPIMAPPGNRTPIAKRYQPILPKGARSNPFANIPSDVNKILKDAGTEIKSIANDTSTSKPLTKVYGPKVDKIPMGPPPLTNQHHTATPQSTGHRVNAMSKPGPSNKSSNSNYLNLALFNATKSKGNEAPPGCQTPMYTPNSPIYSPNSPQYVSNYNIPTMPTYKYTPKPTNNSYLNNVLGTNSQLSSLFPAPPTKKDNSTTQNTKQPAPKSEYQPPKRVYPFTRSPSPIEDPPEKQLKVKSLLTSCNINIPSSLSITITREDSESQLSTSSYPKHKSPVNNYIEILKLPDQPSENLENNRLSPPAQQKPATETLAQIKKDNANYKPMSTPHQKSAIPPPTQNNKFQNSNSTNVTSKSTVNIHSLNQPKTTTAPSTHTTNVTKSLAEHVMPTFSNHPTPQNLTTQQQKPLQTTATKTPYQKQALHATPTVPDNKKTPSPEKRQSDVLNSPACDKSSPKSPNTAAAESASMLASKKFRHILPRQNSTPISEVIPPKVTNASIIGTYASPSGVAVKVHGNKKVPPTKKSPGQQQHEQLPKAQSHDLAAAAVVKEQLNSLSNPSSIKVSTSAKSPHATNYSNASNNTTKSNTTAPQVGSPNTSSNKVVTQSSPSSLATMPNIPHPMQAMVAGIPNFSAHLGAAAAAAAATSATSASSQAEFCKFLKDNLLRAQMQAAANQSNMLYSYANAAAQMSQYTPSMYNYQQACIMEQLSRMQRAGNEYMQKLKNEGVSNGVESPKAPRPISSPKTTSAPSSSPISTTVTKANTPPSKTK